MTDNNTPSPRHALIIAALVAGKSWHDITREAGCSMSTDARVARQHRVEITQDRADRARQSEVWEPPLVGATPGTHFRRVDAPCRVMILEVLLTEYPLD